MLWFLMITLPLVLAIAHNLLLKLDSYTKTNSVFIIPAIIIGYCIFALCSVYDRDALPAILIAIYYIGLTTITIKATFER